MWDWFKRTAVAGGLLLCLAASPAIGQEDPTNKPALGEAAAKAETFKQPATLDELLALPIDQLENVDIALISLLCAEGLPGAENLSVPKCMETLDVWTKHVERETRRNFHRYIEHPRDYNNSLGYYQMGMLGTILAEDLRIQYNPELEEKLLNSTNRSFSPYSGDEFFSSSRDIFLHGLLTGKHFGTCASMPMLYAAIGRRLGYPVTICARKRHLYVQYDEGSGKHLNVESTENLGFSTPTDDEYRHGPFPMTDQEIREAGWMKPLNNSEVLGICLCNRSACLRTAKRYDDEIKTLADAARYLPNAPLLKRGIEQGQVVARQLRSAMEWERLRNELDNLSLPTGGPRFQYFEEKKRAVQILMNQNTNLAEIKKSLEQVKTELKDYRGEISDDMAKMAEAFSPSATANEAMPLPIEASVRRVRIPQERVPAEYWHGVPPALLARLQKLTSVDEMIEEMNVFYAEQLNMRNQETRNRLNAQALPPRGVQPQAEQMSKAAEENATAARRSPVDQELLMHPFLQIELVSGQEPDPATRDLPLTTTPQPQTIPATSGAGQP